MDEHEAKVLQKAKTVANAHFVELVLRKSENDPTIRVSNVGVKFATNKGDNFASDMMRLNVEYNRNNNSDILEKRQLVVKFAPMTECAAYDRITKSTMFDTEIKMMSDTLEKMNHLLGKDNRVNGRCLHVQRENPLFLVIEDLAPLGFRMSEQKMGLDLDHCALVMRTIAKFHASSVAVCEKEPHLRELYQNGLFSPSQPSDIPIFFKKSLEQIAEAVSTWKELDPIYSEKLFNLANTFYKKGRELLFNYNPNDFNVINHGDFWINNILFKYDNKGTPIKAIFVDFQNCTYTSPASDLIHFFNTSITDDMLLEHENYLLEEYRKTLVTEMAKLGCRTQPITMNELKAALVRKAFMGMFATFMVLPYILVDKDAICSTTEILSNDGKINVPGVHNKLYRAALVRRLKVFDQLGLLD